MTSYELSPQKSELSDDIGLHVTDPSDAPVVGRRRIESVIDVEMAEQIEHLTALLSQSEKKTHQLELELARCHTTIAEMQGAYEANAKEVEKFVLAGGGLGGETRDRIIRTLQEQLQVREEEVNFYKSERMSSEEDQRRDERLLISAVHSIALRYHEEMIRTFDTDGNPASDESQNVQGFEDDDSGDKQKAPVVDSNGIPNSPANHFQIREVHPLDQVN